MCTHYKLVCASECCFSQVEQSQILAGHLHSAGLMIAIAFLFQTCPAAGGLAERHWSLRQSLHSFISRAQDNAVTSTAFCLLPDSVKGQHPATACNSWVGELRCHPHTPSESQRCFLPMVFPAESVYTVPETSPCLLVEMGPLTNFQIRQLWSL